MKKKNVARVNPALGVTPLGVLLEFEADLNSEFGFAYERFLDFEKSAHAHNRFVICTARTGSEFEVKNESTGKKFLCNRRLFIFKSPGTSHFL